MQHKDLITTGELAKILGVSRVTIFKRIKKGYIKAEKIGRNFVISKEAIAPLLSGAVSQNEERALDQAIKKTVAEYGETLKLLGAE